MPLPALALGLAVFFAYSLYLLFRGQSADLLTRRAHSMLREACDGPDDKAADLLARCCAECERVVTGHPRHVFAWHVWGSALWHRGLAAESDQADRLYAEAQEKFACALEVKPDDTKLTLDLFHVLWDRALLHPGVMGLEHLEQICEECQRLLILKPREATLLNFWGSALSSMGSRTSGPEADRYYAEAEEKFKQVLAIAPNQLDAMSSLGNVLWRRARLGQGTEAAEFLHRAGEWLDTALRMKPSDARALSGRAWILYARTKLVPGEETNRMLAAAAGQLRAAQSQEGGEALRQGLGVVLWAQSRCSEGGEARRLLQEAKGHLEAAERHEPGAAAYNLACVCAQLDEPDQCRRWLEKSREPGILVSREQMAGEEELARVRQSDWFKGMLG